MNKRMIRRNNSWNQARIRPMANRSNGGRDGEQLQSLDDIWQIGK
jgi:hypothetical protein